MTSIFTQTKKNVRSFSSDFSHKNSKKIQTKSDSNQCKKANIYQDKKTTNLINLENNPNRPNSKLKVKLDKDMTNNIQKVSRKAHELRSNYDRLNNMLSIEKTKSEKADQEIYDFANLLKKEQSRNFVITKDITTTKNKLGKSTDKTLSMLKFSKTIRERWNNISETIKLFQETINEIEQGNNKLAEEYAKTCNDLTSTNLYLHQTIKSQIKETKDNENKIRELEIREKYLREELNEEKKMINKKESFKEEKKKELDFRIIHESKNYSDMTSLVEKQEGVRRKTISTNKYKEKNQVLLEMKINELMGKNHLLKQEIYDLNLKLNRPKMPISLIRNKSVSFSSEKRK